MVPLPSRLATGDLAWASVTALLQVIYGSRHPAPDPDRIAMAYRSDRVFRIDDGQPSVWSPFSGFWRVEDGWIRTHGNYPHHARAMRRGLGLPESIGVDELRAVLSSTRIEESVNHITAAGGLAVAVRPEDPARDSVLRTHLLVDIRRVGDAALRERQTPPDSQAPLDGIRVLDLTRVIAGPVCTRTLALLGADVLRIDPPHLPEPEWQHLDSGHGKRSALLDARSDRMRKLLEEADVVVLGYRPAALARLALSPAQLAVHHPGLIIAQLSAWGLDQPDRAGFDSLVQAESGIALIESIDGEVPGVLPAQALDHSAGYLLAAAVCEVIRRRRREGGTWHIATSLRRVAAELLGMPRRDAPESEREIDATLHTRRFHVDGHSLITAAPVLPGFSFAAPRPWGRDVPQW